MKKIIWLFCGLILCSFSAFAESNKESTDKKAFDPIEDRIERLNVIKPEQYIEMVGPIRRDIHKRARNLSKAEAITLINTQNKINKVVAHQNDEPKPEPIDIDPTDKVELELLMLPAIYTYDDPIPTHE